MAIFPGFHAPILALEFNSATLLVFGVVGIVVLGVIYFAVRFWLISTRPADIREVNTPTLDRLNQNALQHMAGTPGDDEHDASADDNDEDQDDDEEAPEGLKSALPEDES